MSKRRTVSSVVAGLLVAGFVTAAPAVAAAPTITSFTPTSGPVNTTVTITGTGFTAGPTVRFGGVASTVVSYVSATTVTAKVPAGAPSGPISVTTTGGTATSSASFTVAPGLVLTPTFGPPTTTTTIHLSGFSPYEAIDVYFDTADIGIVSANAGGVATATETVPASATPGAHWLTLVGRHSGYSAQAKFSVYDNWAQPNHDPAGQGYNSYENVLSNSVVSNGLDETWRAGPGGSASAEGTAVANGIVYAGFGDGTIRAFNETTGAQDWSQTLANTDVSPVAVANGLAYIAAGSHLYAFNATTGAQVWTMTLFGSFVAPPLVIGTTLFVSDSGDYLSEFNATTGSLLRFTDFEPSYPAELAASGNTLMVGLSNGYVYAYDIPTGNVDWYNSVSGFVKGLTIGNGLVYVTNDGGPNVYAFRIDTGALLWSTTVSGTPSPAAFARGILYFGADSGAIVAMTAANGAVRWSTTTPGGTQSPVDARPAWADGVLYVTSTTDTMALTAANGNQLWFAPESNYYSSAAIADGAVFVATVNDRMVAYAASGVQPQARPDARTLHP